MTPLEYCFHLNRKQLVRAFCKYFKQNFFRITVREYNLLLADKTLHAHDALAKLTKVPEIVNLPSFKYNLADCLIETHDKKFGIVESIRKSNERLLDSSSASGVTGRAETQPQRHRDQNDPVQNRHPARDSRLAEPDFGVHRLAVGRLPGVGLRPRHAVGAS